MNKEIFANKEIVEREIKAIQKANALGALGFTMDEILENVKGQNLWYILAKKIDNTLRAYNKDIPGDTEKTLQERKETIINLLEEYRQKTKDELEIKDYNTLLYIVKNLDKIKPFM